jgi:hypothetical protein
VCVYDGVPGAGDDPCRRIVADLHRRRALTDAEHDGMLSTMESVTGALHRRTRSECQPDAGPCALTVLPADVTEVRGQLAGAGYPDAVVRPYRPDDPAPADSVVYAVRAGDVCLVGYLPSNRTGQLRAVGPYPDGTCLAR